MLDGVRHRRSMSNAQCRDKPIVEQQTRAGTAAANPPAAPPTVVPSSATASSREPVHVDAAASKMSAAPPPPPSPARRAATCPPSCRSRFQSSARSPQPAPRRLSGSPRPPAMLLQAEASRITLLDGPAPPPPRCLPGQARGDVCRSRSVRSARHRGETGTKTEDGSLAHQKVVDDARPIRGSRRAGVASPIARCRTTSSCSGLGRSAKFSSSIAANAALLACPSQRRRWTLQQPRASGASSRRAQ